jgi:RimJ/RimL family protein N-acetyltransferase
MPVGRSSTDETRARHEIILAKRRSRKPRAAALDLAAILQWNDRLRPTSFQVEPAERADIPEIVRLLETRKTWAGLPLKFKRTPALLEHRWCQGRWILARRNGRLVGCVELRPIEEEPGAWEIGSFSQSADNRNPRVSLKLLFTAFSTLAEIGARAAVIEVHRLNDPVWAFVARFAFVPDSTPATHPDFVRYRMPLA